MSSTVDLPAPRREGGRLTRRSILGVQLCGLVGALFCCLIDATTALPRVDPGAASRFEITLALRPGESAGDHPVRLDRGARGDTIDFGYYEVRADGQVYAVDGGAWTWDHDAEDPLEGWTSLDLTANRSAYWRFMTSEIWLAGGNPLPWPAIHGGGMALCGARKGEADSLGWAAGIGYGNDWCQRLAGPAFSYDGSGAVPLAFAYFNESEYHYDYTKVFIESGGSRVMVNQPGFSGRIGIDTGGVITPVVFTHAISNAELGGGTQPRVFRVVIEFDSDGGLSDEDGADAWNSYYGAVGVDDVTAGPDNLDPPVTSLFDFETDLQGWTAMMCPGIGSFLGVAPRSAYDLQDPCQCQLSGNIVELHNDAREHVSRQHEMIVSPIIDRKADLGDPAYLEYNRVMADYDYYVDQGSFGSVICYRAGWSYFPWQDPNSPGLELWSPRVGDPAYYYAGGPLPCGSARSIGTDWGVPADAEKVRFIFEIWACCDCWCDGCICIYDNFSPFIDNVRVRTAHAGQAPGATFGLGGRFQDGFSQSADEPLANQPGNADVAGNVRPAGQPARLGDSLSVTGPLPTLHGGWWEARLWWRLPRIGPRQADGTALPDLANCHDGEGDSLLPARPPVHLGVHGLRRDRRCGLQEQILFPVPGRPLSGWTELARRSRASTGAAAANRPKETRSSPISASRPAPRSSTSSQPTTPRLPATTPTCRTRPEERSRSSRSCRATDSTTRSRSTHASCTSTHSTGGRRHGSRTLWGGSSTALPRDPPGRIPPTGTAMTTWTRSQAWRHRSTGSRAETPVRPCPSSWVTG